MKENQEALHVHMLGNFYLLWDGKTLTGNSKSGESQFIYLMQMLLHNRKNGVGRDMLEDVLFGDRDMDDVHHALRNLIYNAKRRLKAAGLPDVNYIEQRQGVYFWTDKIPVVEDAVEFERLYREAEAERNQKRRLQLYLDACQSYTGEFLPTQAGVLWAAQEARRYGSIFCVCVEEAVRLLRDNRDFDRMEKLGLYAAKISPLSDWETITMEALMALGRYDEAKRFYVDTVDLYFREQSVHPPQKLMDFFQKLGELMEHQYETLDDIQRELRMGDRDGLGGYMCPYPVFQGIYNMMERVVERGGQSVYLMLCMVVDSKGNPMKEGTMLEELTERLGEAIRNSVRNSDVVCKYGKGQYLVLLMNTAHENCKIIQKRINNNFLVGRQRTGIRYYVNSISVL